MTDDERRRLEWIAKGTTAFTPMPTRADVMLALKEIARLNHALDAALWDAAERAFTRTVQKGRRS